MPVLVLSLPHQICSHAKFFPVPTSHTATCYNNSSLTPLYKLSYLFANVALSILMAIFQMDLG